VRLRVPHTFVLLFALIAVAAIATHIIPAGSYDRIDQEGRQLVVPGSWHRVPSNPAGPGEVFLAFPRGLVEAAPIVIYIFLIGGAFGVVNATGAIEAGIALVVRAARGRGLWALALLMVLFSVGGGTIGLAEETLPFLPALVLLARRLGYDAVTGCAVALVGAGAGFAGAFLNPFTVGVAQGIAGLPLFSGMGYRLVVWLVVTALAVVHVLRYAAGPGRLHGGAEIVERASEGAIGGTQQEKPLQGNSFSNASASPASTNNLGTTMRPLLVLGVLALGLAAVVAGSLWWGWGLIEMGGLFVAVAVGCGLVGGLGADGTAQRFLEGAAGIAAGALVVGLARGVLVVLDGARVTDTVLHAMANAVEGLPAQASLAGIYAVQVALSYLVPSGSGQAALSIPILAPLADLVGVTRQTSVLAYQFGDGFSNIFTPTSGYFMAALALAGIPWTRWARFLWPLQLQWLAAGLVLLWIAHAIRWGPF
jgi:uncharacterized ion transporter superfamily protein YfcC